MTTMTDSRAADVLAAHNEWRRGGDGPQTEPVTLGLALERAIARLREPAVVGGVKEVNVRFTGVGEGGPYPVSNGVCIIPSVVARKLVASAVGEEMKREALSKWAAPQPPAEAQAQGGGEVVLWHVVDEFGDLIAAYTDGATAWRVAGDWTNRGVHVRPLIYGDTAPPSAPVGVEDIAVELEHFADCPGRVLALAGKLRALAQQPAADEEAAEQYRKGWEAGHVAAQQPAAVDGAMVDRVTDAVVAWGSLPGDPPAEPEQVAELRGVIAAAFAAHALAAQPGGSDNE